MYMLTHISLTPGTILFLAGMAVTVASVILAVIMSALSGKEKQAIQNRMKEKY